MNQPAPQSLIVRAWQSPLPLADVAQSSLDKAVKLQSALARALAAVKEISIAAAVQNFALADYARVFGYSISDRALRALVTRTLDRDAGSQNWARLELYVSENPARKTPSRPVISLAVESEFRQLHEAIRNFQNPLAPSLTEKSWFWLRAFELYEEKLAEGKAPKKTRRNLLKFLERNAPFLAGAESACRADALRVNFNRKYTRWIASGRDANSLADARAENSGRWRAPALPEYDENMLLAAAAKFGGGIDQGWYSWHPSLPLAIQSYYQDRFCCPRRIRKKIEARVEIEKNNLHGPRHAKLTGAHSKLIPHSAAGDWDQSDDMTMVNMWWEEAPGLPGGFWFGQGQFLPWRDDRSWFIYSWVLISDPYYDAFSVRNSWTVKADTWGLPRQGFHLEGGLWATSKILVGSRPAGCADANATPLIETEMGLRRLGLRFYNSPGNPRAKTIERSFGMLQNYFQAMPGYVGRNPLTDRYEDVQKKIRLVKSGRKHPAELGFLHKNQWAEILDRVCQEYNRKPIFGEYHKGRSPCQVFEETFTTMLVKIPLEFRYILSTNKYEREVGSNGIAFQFGNKQFRYKSYQLGLRRGQRVLAWFNPESPETICCTDLDGKNPFIAEIEHRAYDHDPLPGTLEKTLQQNADQNRGAKELHHSLKPYYNSPFFQNLFRGCVADLEAVDTSKEFARLTSEQKTRRQEGERETLEAGRASKRLNMAIPRALRPETLKALKRLPQLLEDEPAAQPKEDA